MPLFHIQKIYKFYIKFIATPKLISKIYKFSRSNKLIYCQTIHEEKRTYKIDWETKKKAVDWRNFISSLEETSETERKKGKILCFIKLPLDQYLRNWKCHSNLLLIYGKTDCFYLFSSFRCCLYRKKWKLLFIRFSHIFESSSSPKKIGKKDEKLCLCVFSCFSDEDYIF